MKLSLFQMTVCSMLLVGLMMRITGAMEFSYIPETVYVPHVHSTDYVVWSKIEATCKHECQSWCHDETTTWTSKCNACEVMPNSSHLFYEKDMRIYKKPCATNDCSSSCPGSNCIPPGETVTVGVRCWMSWQKDYNRQYTTATFDIVSVSEKSYSGCQDFKVEGGRLSINATEHCGRVSVSCDPGLRLSGTGSVMCCDGVWNAAIPECLKDCRPFTVPHGKLSSNETVHGSQVNINCDEKYSIFGVGTVTCSSGDWGDMPICYQECRNNHFGENCSLPCDCVVNNTVTPKQSCHSYTGACQCTPSWTGNRCQTICETGNCVDSENYEATRVERFSDDSEDLVLPLSLGFGVFGFVLVVAIVTLVCWRRTKQKRSEQKQEPRQVSVIDILQAGRQTQPPRHESDDDPNYCALNFQNPMTRKADNGCQRKLPSLTIHQGQMGFV